MDQYSSVQKVCVVVIVCAGHVRLHSARRLNVIEELEPEMRGLVTWEASSARMGVPAETQSERTQTPKLHFIRIVV